MLHQAVQFLRAMELEGLAGSEVDGPASCIAGAGCNTGSPTGRSHNAEFGHTRCR